MLAACTTFAPIIVAAAPRSYWSSTNKTPTQHGLLADYYSALLYASRKWPDAPITVYGHSLGGSIAVSLLQSLTEEPRSSSSPPPFGNRNEEIIGHQPLENVREVELRAARRIQGLILENPFSSIPDMVRALYPQKWLPYRFLAPFAWDKWNALAAMKLASKHSSSPTSETVSSHKDVKVTSTSAPKIFTNSDNSKREHYSEPGLDQGVRDDQVYSTLGRVAKNMLVLVSARDEVVPREMGEAIYAARPGGGDARLVVIERALHEDAWRQNQWAREVSNYLENTQKK